MKIELNRKSEEKFGCRLPSAENWIVRVVVEMLHSEGLTTGIVIGEFFRSCLRVGQSSFHWIKSVAVIGGRRKRFLQLRFRRVYDSACHSNFLFSLGWKRSYVVIIHFGEKFRDFYFLFIVCAMIKWKIMVVIHTMKGVVKIKPKDLQAWVEPRKVQRFRRSAINCTSFCAMIFHVVKFLRANISLERYFFTDSPTPTL